MIFNILSSEEFFFNAVIAIYIRGRAAPLGQS